METFTNQCHLCGESFECPVELREFRRGLSCDECEAKEEANRLEIEGQKLEAKRIEAEAIVDELTPARIRCTDINHRDFNADLWKRVSAWKPTQERPWLGLIGMTGESKTRCAFLWVRRQARRRIETSSSDHLRIAHAKGYDFAAITLAKFSRDPQEQEEAREKLWKYRNADVLIFDEMGKLHVTKSVFVELFGLIDHRHANNRVTLWTSNTHPDEFCDPWPEEYAGPIGGRIIESSTILRA